MDAKLSNRSISDVLLSIGLSKQPTFRVGSTGDVWHSILLTYHYLVTSISSLSYLGSASDWSYCWWRPFTGKPQPRSQCFPSWIKIEKERTLSRCWIYGDIFCTDFLYFTWIRCLIVDFCYPVTLLPCYPVSYLPCYPVTLLPCCLVTLLATYPVTLLLCCPVNLLLCYPVTWLPFYLITLLPCYSVTLLPCYLVTLLPFYPVTYLPCYPVTLLPCYLVTLLPFYLFTLLPCYPVTFLLCYPFTLLLCYPVTVLPY